MSSNALMLKRLRGPSSKKAATHWTLSEPLGLGQRAPQLRSVDEVKYTVANRSKGLHKNERSQRQLRVGEMLRRALVDVFVQAETKGLDIDTRSITVTEVRVSPDTKRATVFCREFAGERQHEAIKLLNDARKQIRAALAKRISLKTTPDIEFELDTSFDQAERVDDLLSRDRVKKDLDEPSQDQRTDSAS